MANERIQISALPEAIAALFTHIVPVSTGPGGVTESITVQQIASILPSIASLGAEQDAASAGTVNLSIYPNTVRFRITGTTQITALTLGANKMAFVRFAGALTLTHHATTLQLPGNVNFVTMADDIALVQSDASGNVRVLEIFRRLPTVADRLGGPHQDVASAGTVNLAAFQDKFRFRITGNTTITALTLGANKWAMIRFAAALTLTHHATSLILPTGANITTAADDTMLIETDAAGNVRVDAYWRKDGTALAGISSARQIATQHSLQGGGDLSADRLLSLSGDVASPGNWMAYGTNGSGVRGWIPAGMQMYQSAPQTITAGGTVTLAHGLGLEPKILVPLFRCSVATANWAVGEIMDIRGSYSPSSGGHSAGVIMRADATNVIVRYGLSGILQGDKNTGQMGAVTSNWQLIVRAYG